MMYIRKESLAKLKEDLAKFISSAAPVSSGSRKTTVSTIRKDKRVQ